MALNRSSAVGLGHINLVNASKPGVLCLEGKEAQVERKCQIAIEETR